MVGLDVEHAAACLLWMRRTKHPRRVKLSLDSRESESGDLGELTRDYANGRFALDATVEREAAEARGERHLIALPTEDPQQSLPLNQDQWDGTDPFF